MKKKNTSQIIEYLKSGKLISLISDAGTPSISDPGLVLVNECIKNGIQITPIPGVSAITSALSVSGFKDQFLFYGFLPKKENELNKVLKVLSQNKFAQIFFIPSNSYWVILVCYWRKTWSRRMVTCSMGDTFKISSRLSHYMVS